jgi:hypothetical protein
MPITATHGAGKQCLCVPPEGLGDGTNKATRYKTVQVCSGATTLLHQSTPGHCYRWDPSKTLGGGRTLGIDDDVS